MTDQWVDPINFVQKLVDMALIGRVEEFNDDRGIKVNVKVNDEDITMQLDTGAEVSLASEMSHQNKFPHLPINESNNKLKPFWKSIQLLGYVTGKLHYLPRQQVCTDGKKLAWEICLFGRTLAQLKKKQIVLIQMF